VVKRQASDLDLVAAGMDDEQRNARVGFRAHDLSRERIRLRVDSDGDASHFIDHGKVP
jgi:hypothetical protein